MVLVVVIASWGGIFHRLLHCDWFDSQSAACRLPQLRRVSMSRKLELVSPETKEAAQGTGQGLAKAENAKTNLLVAPPKHSRDFEDALAMFGIIVASFGLIHRRHQSCRAHYLLMVPLVIELVIALSCVNLRALLAPLLFSYVTNAIVNERD